VVFVILNALAKNIIPLIRQKTVLEENKERGNGPSPPPGYVEPVISWYKDRSKVV
jgi:hypothetical protein